MTTAGTWPQAHTHLDIQIMDIICRKFSKSRRKMKQAQASPILLPCRTLLSEVGVSEHVPNSFGPSGHLSSESDDPGNTGGPDLCPLDAISTCTPCRTVTTSNVSRHGLMSPGSPRKGQEEGQTVLADQPGPKAAAPTGVWAQLMSRTPWNAGPDPAPRGCSLGLSLARPRCSQRQAEDQRLSTLTGHSPE